MQLTYTKSKFDVPEGQYVAKFLGVDLLEPKAGESPRLGRDGKPMAPGMAWRFEIQDEGECFGKIADRITGRQPGPKNVCGRFLAAVAGQPLKDGMTVDLNQFVGKIYRIQVEPKEEGNGSRVSEIGLTRIYDEGGAGGPPAKPGAPPRKPATAARFWVEVEGADPDLKTVDEIKALVSERKLTTADTICADGKSDWQPMSVLIPESKSWDIF